MNPKAKTNIAHGVLSAFFGAGLAVLVGLAASITGSVLYGVLALVGMCLGAWVLVWAVCVSVDSV